MAAERYIADRERLSRALALRGEAQADLFREARAARDAALGPLAEVRSVVEYSNACEQRCRYCGMNRASGVRRFVLSDDDLLGRIGWLRGRGRRVVMVQGGETSDDRAFERLLGLLARAMGEHPDLVLMCALGDLRPDKYQRLRAAGVRRYLLKFETSDERLYASLRPGHTLRQRLDDVRRLEDLGFEVSSGNISGLPGQTIESLVDDLLLLATLDLPMGSTSPFIPNAHSELAGAARADLDLTLNFMALLRLLRPAMLIPSTSALELLAPGGQLAGLMAGANAITLHDGTPPEEEGRYLLYTRDRYLPRDGLLEVAVRAGLTPSNEPLIR